jgi:hypothetical protein
VVQNCPDQVLGAAIVEKVGALSESPQWRGPKLVGLRLSLLSAGIGDCPVVMVGVWHKAHPIWLKILAPFCVDAVEGAGFG